MDELGRHGPEREMEDRMSVTVSKTLEQGKKDKDEGLYIYIYI